MDEKKLRTETSIPHSKIGKLPRIQISQWLEDVFLPFCAEWMIPMKKCHKFCFRCSAAMFRSDVRYISISSAQFRYPVMLFPLYQITEAHLASHVQTGLFFLFFLVYGIQWCLVDAGCCAFLAFWKPVWLLKFFNSQLHPCHGHIHQKMMRWKRWSSACIAVDIGIWYISGCTRSNSGYITCFTGIPRKQTWLSSSRGTSYTLP